MFAVRMMTDLLFARYRGPQASISGLLQNRSADF